MKIVTKVVCRAWGFRADSKLRCSRPIAPHRDLTVWVSSQTGTHLGSGYSSSYLTNFGARTLGQEEPKLRTAIDSLDGLVMVRVQGFGLLPAAVAWQTQTTMRKLIEQKAETGLSYGELLIVDSLAARSRHSFSEVVTMRARTRT